MRCERVAGIHSFNKRGISFADRQCRTNCIVPPFQVGRRNWEACFNLAQIVPLGQISCEVARHCDSQLTLPDLGRNNPKMPRPEAAHRVKSYSAATGYVYQYYFYEVEKSQRGAAAGAEYVYMASVDRKHVFPVKIFVARESLEKWAAREGRQFTGTEEYAVAKMRLFQAFDEVEDLASKSPDLVVDESNLEALLAQLDL